MSYDAGLKVGVDGDQEFKSSLNSLNSDLKLFGSELKAVTTEFGRNDKSIEGLTAKNKIYGKEVDTQKSKVQLLTSQYEKQWDELERLGKNLEDVKKIYGENSKEVEKAQKAYDKQETSVKKLESSLTVATSTLNKLEKQMATNTKELALQSSEWTKLGGKLDDVGTKLDKTGAGITNVGQGITVGITAPIVAMGAAAVTAFNEVDGGMDTVIKATGATGEAAEGLEKSFKNVSGSVVGDFESIGGALGEVNTRFGYTGQQLETTSADFMKFARITGVDATTGVQLVARAMGDAGIDSSEYKSILDQLSAAAQASGISVESLTENLTKYGAPMRALGFDTQESIAIFSSWEKAGVNTEIAFAGMKKAISNWSSEGKDAREEFKKTLSAIGEAPDIAEATTMAIEVFGQKAGPDLADAIQGGRFEFEEFLSVVEGADGTLDGTYDELLDGGDKMEMSMANVKEGFSELGETIMETAAPIIDDVAAGVQNLAGWFEKLDPKMQQGIVVTGALVAAVGPAIMVIGGLTSGLGAVFTGIGTVSGAIGVMTTGAAAATPAVAGLAGALTVLTGPIGITVGALALLTAGGFALHEVMTKGKQLTEEQIKANDAFIASSDAVAGAVTANITSRSDSIKASQDEAMAAQELSQKLFDLADKQNKSGAEMQLLTSYVDQFNKLLPNANLLIDEQTGALNLTRDATNELIAAETERIQKQAVNEALVQNAKDQLATKRELNEAQIRQNELEQEYAAGMQAVIEGEGSKNEKQQKANELWAKYQEQLGPVTESVTTLTAKQGELATEQGTLNGLLSDPTGWNAYITGTNTAQAATVTFADGSTKKIQEFGTTAPILMAQTGSNSAGALSSSLTAGVPGVTTSVQTIHDTVKNTTDPLVTELTDTGNKSGVGLGQAILDQNGWIGTNTQIVHDTVKSTTDPLVPELIKTGDDGAHGLGQSILNQNPWIKTNSQLIHDTAKDTTDPLVPELTKTGGDSGQGLGQALGNQNEWVGVNSALIHDTTKNTTDPLVGELSTTGKDAGFGLGDRLGSNEDLVKTKAGLLYSAADGKISPLPGVITGYGGDAGQGLINGMGAKEEEVGTTSNKLVQKVLTVFKSGFGIASPSKEMYSIGAFTMDGFLNSLLDGSVNVMGFINKMIEEIKAAFAAGNFNLKGAIDFVGTGAAEFFKSIGIGGASLSGLTKPVDGEVTDGFGMRIHPITGEEKFHSGIDIGASEGTPVGAAGAGEVTMAGWNGGYGNCVMINHGNGLETLYGHLSAIMVSVGDLVSAGQTIGAVGSTGNSTGPHLHFEISQNGELIDPGSLWGFDVGSRYVPRDMVAMIHEGEMIVPKHENPYANSGGQTMPAGTKIEQTVNIYSPQALSPSQTARINKRALQELALGL